MIITKEVEMRWNNRSKTRYIELGYVFTKNNDLFMIKTEHLPHSRLTKVEYQCDYCGIIKTAQFSDLMTGRKVIQKDACSSCRGKKMLESTEKTYGCHPMELETVQNKVKQTMMTKYGVDNYTKTDEYNIKVKETSLQKHGTEHHTQSEIVKNKQQATIFEKYGVDNYTKTDEYKERVKTTNLEKYGVENVMQNPEIKEKLMNSLYYNDTAPSSQQQRHINSLLGSILNYPVGNAFLDMAFPNEKIYIEYDGGGHDLCVKLNTISQKDFDHKERKRTYFLLKEGWKEIRIISSDDKLPSDEEIISFIECAKNVLKERSSVKWDLNSNEVTISFKITVALKEFLQIQGVM